MPVRYGLGYGLFGNAYGWGDGLTGLRASAAGCLPPVHGQGCELPSRGRVHVRARG
ncbi:hypothetical protein GCM10012287_35720 [Streptomyces daqingensis]|uniref:Uncharacterized protein n=1 Tax=Streptomyces daqingensis TaxID=1472640 RepID=A0ABQ2MI01_9ACTN|nr:hypothetical protein GCM10012287_35720 [Streptomyces daqingensis]